MALVALPRDAITGTLRILLAALCMLYGTTSFANSDDGCDRGPRISDAQALRIAKAELKRRSPTFNPMAFDLSVQEDACDLRVQIKDKHRARLSTLVLSRSGEIKLYWGPM
jgi:hypothetical protein